MPEPPLDPLALEATALRYAARTLPAAESEAFESRLAGDQSARDALAEAVRLSAAALDRDPPAPDASFRALIRERLRPLAAWRPAWLPRRAYRGHPLAWAACGAGFVAAATLVGISLAGPERPRESVADSRLHESVAPLHRADSTDGPTLPALEQTTADGADDAARKEAEIWADLTTAEHVEKTHDDEARWHLRLKHLHVGHSDPPRPTGTKDSHEP